ncbi:MAG: STAS domain-containing protein [Candidatus Binatia bacterium]
MAINVKTQVQAGKGTIALEGRFDFTAHREFRAGYEQVLSGESVKSLDIDLHQVSHMDSSALGMLLLVRERTDAVKCEIALINCPPSVRKVLEIANFQKLFRIT